jgi:hypothetical protein
MTRWTPRRPRPRLLCVVCREDDLFFDVTPVACVHAYCRHCVQDLFRRSFKDESLFPPRCCGQPILPGSIRFFLTAEIVEQYEEARVEFSDPDRAYCSLPTCSSYIRRENIVAGQATCPPCTTQSCSFCKKNGMRETALPITIFSSSLQRQLRKVGSVAAIAEQWSNTLLVAII